MPDLTSSRAQHGLKIVTHRRPDPVPAAQREARAARRRARRCRRAYGGEFRAIVYENDIDHVDHVALVKGEIRPDDAGARARAQRVPDRRRLRLAALRLRRAARGRDEDDRGGGPRRAPLHAPGRPRHRAQEQDPRLRPPGPGRPRHGRGERAARLPGRPARLRRRRADPRRPRRAQDAPDHEQPGQARRASRATASRSSSACRSRSSPTRRTSSISARRRRSSGTFFT